MADNLPAIKTFTTAMAGMEKQFASVLPAQVPTKRFLRTAIMAVEGNPGLLQCDRQSLYHACKLAAQDGLIVDGREAALVKFGNKATYMPMTAGIIKKVRNSGELSCLSANVVHEKDTFTYELGDNEQITHKPALTDRGEAIGAYAIATLKDGSKVREWMSKDEIEEVRAVSRAKSSGPWVTWWGEMARKTVIRRLSKRLPMSSELDRVITSVDDDYDFSQSAEPAATETTGPSKFEEAVGLGDDDNVVEGEIVEEEPPPPDDNDAPKDGDLI